MKILLSHVAIGAVLLYYGHRKDHSTQAVDTHPIHKIYSIAHPRSQHLILLLELLHYEERQRYLYWKNDQGELYLENYGNLPKSPFYNFNFSSTNEQFSQFSR